MPIYHQPERGMDVLALSKTGILCIALLYLFSAHDLRRFQASPLTETLLSQFLGQIDVDLAEGCLRET